MKKLVLAALLPLAAFGAAELNWSLVGNPPMGSAYPKGQYLMYDNAQNKIVPSGYTLGLDQLAAAAAANAAASNRVEAVRQATEQATQIVSNLTNTIVGNSTFGYIDLFNVSFGGAAFVSDDASCQILKIELKAAGSAVKNGTLCDGHYVWFYFSEPMNTTPYLKWSSTLTVSTNDWQAVPFSDMVGPLQAYTLEGNVYDNLYRATVWMDQTLTSAFYLAYCEVAMGDGDGSVLQIHGGITVNGFTGPTTTVIRPGAGGKNYKFKYVTGVLIGPPEEVEAGDE